MSLVSTVSKAIGALMTADIAPSEESPPPAIVAPAPAPTQARASTVARRERVRAQKVTWIYEGDMMVPSYEDVPEEGPETPLQLAAEEAGYGATATIPERDWFGDDQIGVNGDSRRVR